MGGTPVATRDVFSAEELAQLRGFPEIGRGELVRTALLHVLTSGSD